MGNNKLEMFVSAAFAKAKGIIIKNRYALLFCFIFSVLYVLPLLLADVYYRDDLRRSINGLGWSYDGRGISTFIMSKLTGGGYITDYFPFSQIFSATIVAISGYILVSIIGLEKNRKIKLSSLLLLINPFLLENLSYRWDSIPMAISIAAVIIPFLFVSSNVFFILASVVGICITMFTYQASVPIFILMALVILIRKCINGDKNLFKNIILFGVGFLCGLIVYKLLTWNIDLGERSSFIPLDQNLFNNLSANISIALNLAKLAFSQYFTILVVISIFFCLLGYVKFIKSDKPVLYKIIVPWFGILVVVFIPIVILLLKEVWVGARLLVTFPFLIYSILILVENLSSKITSSLSLFFIILSFALMTAYSNSLKAQANLETMISHKIGQTVDVKNKKIVFIGRMEYASEACIALQKYPLLQYIIPSYFGDDWGIIAFSKANGFMYSQPILDINDRAEIITNKKQVPIVDETFYYVLRTDSSKVIIDMDASESKRAKIIIP